ncbi:serine--tRNA ligase [Candidatus Woesearchaeota archaeon]|nr:serine--tRNA ligase [Candidatus Woesearchaeota archaeon]MCF7901099.1 serine--tRNA ligase [Candidatus Woesearchaeota archaeon]MCF8013432.1 serine--tRNA ligase [Candidatus Woesearchaeota archaeon]
MLDIKLLRENAKAYEDELKKRFLEDRLDLVSSCLSKDEEWRKIKFEEDALRKKRNELSQKVNELKKKGDDASLVIEEVKLVPKKISELEEKRKVLKEEINAILRRIPTLSHESVPKGKDDSENVTLTEVGEKKEFDFEIKNHVELLEEKDFADFETAANLSGNGFYLLKGDFALLNQALIRFTIEFMQRKKYTYIEPPLMIHKKVLDAAMDTAAFDETIYKVQGDDDLNLIGTSEHVLLGMHEGQTFPEDELPKKYFSYTMCFRQEIGSHGINEKGLWRTHQFNKIEQFIFSKPNESHQMFEELLQNTEELMKHLELPYRVIEICTGDLSIWKNKSYDVEVYRPTTNTYGEVASLSNCVDYQAHDLNIKLLNKKNERETVHTLNNTAIATSRILVAIVENYQNKDGSISVPKVLRPYMFGKEVIGQY